MRETFYVTGGNLRADSPSYVERPADRELWEALCAGEYCYLLTSRQMGKSSLMVRTAARLKQAGCRVAVLDLTAVGQNLSPEQWYNGLLLHLGQQLDCEDELEEFWLAHDRLGPCQRFFQALRQVALPRAGVGCSAFGVGGESSDPGGEDPPSTFHHPTPTLVVFVEEVDVVQSLPFSTDEFFAAVRECFTGRVREPDLERLVFCLLGVATPSDLIRDTRLTPFNIGRRIELKDFTETEAAPLAQGLASEQQTGALLQRILYWTGGHPYLTQRLCQAVAQDGKVMRSEGVDQHCRALFLSSSARERDDNLLFVRERLLRSEADRASLLDLYAKVRGGKRVRDDDTSPLVSLLKLSGVTRVVEGYLRARNRIYKQVFDREWIRAHMPDAELRRQRAAYRRGVMRTAGVGGVVLLAMGLLTGVAVRQSQRAHALAQQERLTSGTLRRNLYVSDMNVAYQSWYAGNAGRARDLLEAHRPAPGEEDLRGFEWRHLWRLCRDDSLHTFEGLGGMATAALSPDGTTLAVGHGNGNVELWDVTAPTRPRAIATLAGPASGVANGSMAFSRDGRMLAVGSIGGRVTLWDVAARKATASFPGVENETGSVAFALAPDGKTLALGSKDHAVRLWGITSRQVKRTIRGYRSTINTAVFSPDGKLLATGDGFGTVRLLETASWRERATLKYRSFLGCLAFSPDGRTLAASGGDPDAPARIWDVASRREIATLRGHNLGVGCVAFSPDGRILATGGMDQLAKLWDTASWRERATLVGHTKDVSSVDFSRDGRMLATGGTRTVKLWSTAPKGETSLPTGSAAAFSPDGRLLAVVRDETTMTLWDVARQETVTILKAPGKPSGENVVDSIAFSPDGRMLASCRDDRVRLWDIPSQRQVQVFPGLGGVGAIAFSPDGTILATGGIARGGPPSHREVVLWNVASKQRIAAFEAAEPPVAFSPDGKTLATADRGNREVILWDVATRRRMYTTAGHRDLGTSLAAIAFAPDGKTLAIGSYSTVVVLLDVATREEKVIKGHLSWLACLAFSPDGKILATGGGDHMIKLWNIATRAEAATLPGHREFLVSVAFSPDGNLLASTDGADRVRLWRAATPPETIGENARR